MKRANPKKTRIRKSSSYVDNAKRQDTTESRKNHIDAMLNGQRFVDTWNTEYVGKNDMKGVNVSEHFDNIQLEDGLVIQMYMENPIKYIARKEDGEIIHIDYNIRQIDARQHNTDKPHWVPTPFPVIDKGIIMAISPRTMLWYYEQQEKLAKFNPEAAAKMVIPAVGDIVYTKHFMLKDKRYYTDKQKKCEDMVKNQLEIRLNEFDFLFLIDNYDIESVVKADKVDLMKDKQIMIDSRYTEISSDDLIDISDSEDNNIIGEGDE